MIDFAVPRDIDPAVREVEGIHLFDMDDLEQVVKRNAVGRQAAAEAAEKLCRRKCRLSPQTDGRAGRADDRRSTPASR